MSEIIGIGAAVFDTLITVDGFPSEDTKQCADHIKLCGGGPVATGLVAAAKLGASCGFIGMLSDDMGGNYLYRDFLKYNVDVTDIKVMRGYRSFTSTVLLNKQNGSRTCVYDRGDLPHLSLSKQQKIAVEDAEILMLDGNELEEAIKAARVAHKNDALVLYDAGGMYPGVDRLLPLADILIPSEEFALNYTGKDDVYEAAKALFEISRPQVIVITRGKKGGIMYDGTQLVNYPIYPAEVVDSNGAGDVFHGAFAAALVRGLSFEQACHFSSAVSALKCTKIGARESVPSYEETIEYLRRNGYEL